MGKSNPASPPSGKRNSRDKSPPSPPGKRGSRDIKASSPDNKSGDGQKQGSETPASKKYTPVHDPDGNLPDFIYCGPFIRKPLHAPFVETVLPMKLQQSGIFSKSYAYFSLKERMPVIITKVIDKLSKKGDADSKAAVEGISKMKHDLMTNKDYDPFIIDTEKIDDVDFLLQSVEWNKWMDALDQKKYYNNSWLWTECYIYRKMREQCLMGASLKNFDPFEEQKNQSVADNLEPMCIVAERVVTTMLDPEKPRDQRKLDFQLLTKLCLFGNKCDLSHSVGQPAPLGGSQPVAPKPPPAEGEEPPPEEDKPCDPIQMLLENKDKFLTDNSAKAFEQLNKRVDKMRARLEKGPPNFACACNKVAHKQGLKVYGPIKPPKKEKKPAPVEGEEQNAEAPPPPPPPCPMKITLPACPMYDIILDNAGYELFTDLCFATYLIEHKMADKIRFHAKDMPWFVSDVTLKDFVYLISACKGASYQRTIPNKDPVPEGEEPPPPRVITAEHLHTLANKWEKWLANGTFKVYSEPFWTSPHVFRDMKKYDYWLYRKMQMAVGAMYKGDLNYRKLIGDIRTNPQQKLDPSLLGYQPCPALIVRTIKSEVVCGLKKGKWDVLTKQDPEWMRKGFFGVIQYSNKAERFKAADRPCEYYGDRCMGVVCPENLDFWGADPPKTGDAARGSSAKAPDSSAKEPDSSAQAPDSSAQAPDSSAKAPDSSAKA